MHSFCDAFIQVYSTAVYVRPSENDNIVTNLLTAKSKIKSNRKLTVSKLELTFGLILSRLIVSVMTALSVQVKYFECCLTQKLLCGGINIWHKSGKFGELWKVEKSGELCVGD